MRGSRERGYFFVGYSAELGIWVTRLKWIPGMGHWFTKPEGGKGCRNTGNIIVYL